MGRAGNAQHKTTTKGASKLVIWPKRNTGSYNSEKNLTMYFSKQKSKHTKNSSCRSQTEFRTQCSYHGRHNQTVAVHKQNTTPAQNHNVGVARCGARRAEQYKHTIGTVTHRNGKFPNHSQTQSHNMADAAVAARHHFIIRASFHYSASFLSFIRAEEIDNLR